MRRAGVQEGRGGACCKGVASRIYMVARCVWRCECVEIYVYWKSLSEIVYVGGGRDGVCMCGMGVARCVCV